MNNSTNVKTARKEPVWPVDETGGPVKDALAALILNDESLAYDTLTLLHRHDVPVNLDSPNCCGGGYAIAVNVPTDRLKEAQTILRESGFQSVVV